MNLTAASAARRATFALLATLALALRLLSPAGFMPSFAGGVMAIVACPDAGPNTGSMHGHGDGGGKGHHQSCPFATGASAGPLPGLALAALPDRSVGPDLPQPVAAAHFDGQRTRDRPPATGPPTLSA